MHRFSSIFIFLVGAAVIGWLSFDRESTPETIENRRVHASNATTPQPALTTPPARAAVVVLDPLANLDPFAALALRVNPFTQNSNDASLQKLRDLQRGRSLSEAQLEAAKSDDPLVHVNALHMMLPCMLEPVQMAKQSASDHLARISLDPKTGQPRAIKEKEIEFAALRANGGPQRIYPPEEVRAAIKKEMDEPWEERSARFERGERDFDREMQLWRATLAPLNIAEREAFDEVRTTLANSCDGKLFSNDFGPAYRAQRDKLAAQGVLSALIFNENAGWTSQRSLSALSERDFALVERGIREQHPDVLAMLLLRLNLNVELDAEKMPPDEIGLALGLNYHGARLVACALQVAYCGRGSQIFQELCLSFGGCDQPDAPTLMRSVLVRDGLDPALMDEAVTNMVLKIRAGDLEALGIRRKK
jgi:hypothetical protein